MSAALDNDVVIKGVCYGLLQELVSAIPSKVSEVGLLGASQFVIPAKLRRATLNCDCEEAIGRFSAFAGAANYLEPTSEEASFAAELESIAQQENLFLDSGESQLTAIVILRSMEYLVTGDKRAICALEKITAIRDENPDLSGRVVCMEQLFSKLIVKTDATHVRDSVCDEPAVDIALSICFGCASGDTKQDDWEKGLQSYIDDLRRAGERVLAK